MDAYITLVLSSFSLGIALAAPIGPIGAAAIRHGLTKGSQATFLLGLGATLSDFVYIVLVYLGVTPLLVRLSWLFPLLYLVGAVILVRMGWSTIREAIRKSPTVIPHEVGEGKAPQEVSRSISGRGNWRRSPLLLGFALGTVNPVAIAQWMTIGLAFIAANLLQLSLMKALFVIGSISLGSALWFLLLAGLIGLARVSLRRLPVLLRGIAFLSGASLLGFALVFIWQGTHLIWH